MSNKINELADEKSLEQSSESTVSIVKKETLAEKRIRNRRQALEKLPAGAALEEASSIAMAIAHKAEIEAQKGCKVSRKERSQIMRNMTASIQACANVGYRIKQGISPDDAMLGKAMEQKETLEKEIRAAAPHAPMIAMETAHRAGMENLAADLSTVETAEHIAHVGAESGQNPESGAGMENQPADSAPVATAEHSSPTQHREKTVATMGRPSTRTDEECDRICEWIQSGKSLQSYCRKHGRQAATIYAWMRECGDFAKAYSRAHEDRADTLVEDMLDIADGLANSGDMVAVMAGKLQIETRKWIAERMRPTKYGAKLEVKQTGRVTFNLGIPRAEDPQVIDVNPVQSALDKP